jgi:UDP-N-acetylglucosamine--N-acetylmuramyl-(pentapeptide) pyrophosphoryl-undecaprenol N-acetylglucosamine transferase
VQVVHLAGPGRAVAVRQRYQGAAAVAAAVVRDVAPDMDTMLGAADLVVCRGGGTTVAELMAVGRPAVIVPYPHHKDRQQLHNGRVLAAAGAAQVVDQSGLSPERLRSVLARLLSDPERLRAMGRAARRLCNADATATILTDMQQHGGFR